MKFGFWVLHRDFTNSVPYKRVQKSKLYNSTLCSDTESLEPELSCVRCITINPRPGCQRKNLVTHGMSRSLRQDVISMILDHWILVTSHIKMVLGLILCFRNGSTLQTDRSLSHALVRSLNSTNIVLKMGWISRFRSSKWIQNPAHKTPYALSVSSCCEFRTFDSHV